MSNLTETQSKNYTAMFNDLDKDKSGSVSVAELQKSPLSTYYKFETIDQSGDKKVTLSEFLKFMSS